MQLGFVDESGTEGEEGWFIVSAFIIEANDWMLFDRLEDRIPPDVRSEIEYLKELRHPQDSLSPGRRHEVSMDIYERIDSIGYLVISVIVHQPSASNFCPPGKMYEMAFTYLAERFEYTLEDAKDVGILFVDERDDRTPTQLQELHYELKRGGSRYANFNRTIGAAAPLRDDESIPMSLADWVNSAIRGHYTRGVSDYYQQIIDHIQTHPHSGKIAGSGIKVVPDDKIPLLEFDPDEPDF